MENFTNALKKLDTYKTPIRFEPLAKKFNIIPKDKKGKDLKKGGTAYNNFIKKAMIDLAKTVKPSKIGTQLTEDKTINQHFKKDQPTKTKTKVIDKFNNFEKIRFFYKNIENLSEMYDIILKEYNDSPEGVSFVSLLFSDAEEEEVRWIGINSNYLNTYNEFKGRIEMIEKGESIGSDAIDTDTLKLNLNLFDITSISIKAGGSSADMLFMNENIKSEKKLCGYESLKKCGFDYKEDPKDLMFYDNLVSTIARENLSIAIIANGFKTKTKYTDIVNRGTNKFTAMIKNRRKQEVPHHLSQVLQSDIECEFLFRPEGFQGKHYIIYDEVNSHYDVLKLEKGKPVLCDDVYICMAGNVFKKDKLIFKPSQLNTNTKKSGGVGFKYVVFDYETVIDFEEKSCMKPYSLSIMCLDADEMALLEMYDADVANGSITNAFSPHFGENPLPLIAELRKKCCITFLGYDCSQKFIEWIQTNQENNMFCFIGFNNANFDNFLFLEALLTTNDDSCRVSDIFYNGSQLHNFVVNGRHYTFDIHKHLTGSLKANCDSFKINACSKKSFNHETSQLLYADNKLIDFITNNEELKEYNEYDVMATAVLFQKYKMALENIPATKPYAKDISKIKTIGSLIYKVFQDSKKKKGYDLPKLTFQQYEDLQKSKIAGRVEMFNGIQKVQERLASTDVCSLYPYVMAVHNCYYPTGELKEVDSYQGDDTIGFYYCDIDQSNLKEKNLPNIYAKKSAIENDWSYDGVLKDYLISNVMIGLLLKNGCEVVIKKGFIFTEKRKSCDMFDFLLDFMKAKNNQDDLKGKEGYNSALRETLKLLMNSLSGKVIEGLHTEKTVDIESSYDYIKLKDKVKSINYINTIGNKMFLTYEVDAESICESQQRPIYLGVLIYDYAKRYMYENSYSKIGKSNLLYTDTDASKFRYKDFMTWKKWVDDNNVQVPCWDEVKEIDPRYKNHKIYESHSKVFGSFEDELEDYKGDDYVFYCLEKKSWLYGWKKDGEEWKSKSKFKGLNGEAQLVSLKEGFVSKHTTQHADGSKQTKYKIKPDKQEDAYLHFIHNKKNSLNLNEIAFFDKIYTTGEAYVMCCSFRKIVKNSNRNVNMEESGKFNELMNKIQVCYTIKHISRTFP